MLRVYADGAGSHIQKPVDLIVYQIGPEEYWTEISHPHWAHKGRKKFRQGSSIFPPSFDYEHRPTAFQDMCLSPTTFIVRLSVRTQEVSFRATTRPATRNVKQMARKI